MKKLKQNVTNILFVILIALFLSSCMTTVTNVGKYAQMTGESYKYDKGKQLWVLWGLIPIGRKHVLTPADGNCQVITRFNVFDFLISTITGGIIMTETIKVKVKKQ